MAWIDVVSEEDAEGPLASIYRDAIGRVGSVAEVIKIQSLRPDLLLTFMRFYQQSMFGESELTRAEREMLATVTSHANDCFY